MSPRRAMGLALVLAGCASGPSSSERPHAAPALPSAAASASAPVAIDVAPVDAAPCAELSPTNLLTWSPDGGALSLSCWGSDPCAAADARFLDLWDLHAGGLRASFDTTMTGIRSWPVGSRFLGVVADPTTGVGHAALVDAASFSIVTQSDFYCIQSAALDAKESRWAVAGCDGNILAVALDGKRETLRPRADVHSGGDVQLGIDFVPAGLLLTETSGGLRLLDAATLKGKKSWDPGPISVFEASPAGSREAVVTEDGTLRVVRTRDLFVERTVKGRGDGLDATPLLRWIDEDVLLIGDSSGGLRTLSAVTGASAALLPPTSGHRCFAHRVPWVKAGVRLIALADDCTLAAFDLSLSPPAELWRAELAWSGAEQPGIAVSEDGRQLAVQSDVGVELRSVKSGRTLRALPEREAHTKALPGGAPEAGRGRALAFSPDGRFLALNGEGPPRIVRLEDAAELSLAVVSRAGKRAGVALSGARYAGTPEDAACAGGAGARGLTPQPDLVQTFFAPRPGARPSEERPPGPASR